MYTGGLKKVYFVLSLELLILHSQKQIHYLISAVVSIKKNSTKHQTSLPHWFPKQMNVQDLYNTKLNFTHTAFVSQSQHKINAVIVSLNNINTELLLVVVHFYTVVLSLLPLRRRSERVWIVQ